LPEGKGATGASLPGPSGRGLGWRRRRRGGFAYTEPSGGGIQTVVTDPKGNTTTYRMDSSGRPVQSTNALGKVTKLAWDSDNNVTSLTEDNGAQATWTYDPDTGYPLTATPRSPPLLAAPDGRAAARIASIVRCEPGILATGGDGCGLRRRR
jgi:YD repeat-containing protein